MHLLDSIVLFCTGTHTTEAGSQENERTSPSISIAFSQSGVAIFRISATNLTKNESRLSADHAICAKFSFFLGKG